MKITFLGTGTSHGVPSIDCVISNFVHCHKGVCKESFTDPKQKRTRCSLLIELINDKRLLIDISADFRTQAIDHRISHIDAVLITHSHADHIMGIPDIRSYTNTHPIPLFGSNESLTMIQSSFSYIFNPNTCIGGGIPRLTLKEVHELFTLFDATITPIPVIHGNLHGCYGYRINSVAYIPDVKSIPDSSIKLLKNLDLLIIDCLRETNSHPTHIILPETIALVSKIKPRMCYCTHLSHGINYTTDSWLLPKGMEFSYDGLCVNISDEH